jgi:catechol 2,3-dioxygenase-like lactoylglutathione lyase family enzyme
MTTTFRIGKLFHLTPLVDSFSDAEFFFQSVFAPVCMMRNYSAHWHRHGAIYVIAETSIEPMQPLPPPSGKQGTSWYRYMDQYGPHVHNLAFYVDDVEALDRRLTGAGVRTTDGGAPGPGGTVFAHPKDTAPMLEFSQLDGESGLRAADPRFAEHWENFRAEFWSTRHPLGLRRLSHVTVAVHDVDEVAGFYTGVLDAAELPEQPSTVGDATARFVLVGEDTIVELAQPRDPGSDIGRELATVGQCVTHATFTVRDVGAAREWLDLVSAPVHSADEHDVMLDPARTWNLQYRFTDRTLAGDPR